MAGALASRVDAASMGIEVSIGASRPASVGTEESSMGAPVSAPASGVAAWSHRRRGATVEETGRASEERMRAIQARRARNATRKRP